VNVTGKRRVMSDCLRRPKWERTFASWSETDFINAVASCWSWRTRRRSSNDSGPSLTYSSNRRSALRQKRPVLRMLVGNAGLISRH